MRVTNQFWVDERIKAQRVVPRATSLATVRGRSWEFIGSRAGVRNHGALIPSWVIFGMVLLATFAVCVTVNMRTRGKLLTASEQYALIQTDVQTLKTINQALQLEVDRLKTDPQTIESAARSRLNMLRSNEIVVPIE